jgi:hypothetical protein
MSKIFMLIILLWRSKYHLRSRERRGTEKRRGGRARNRRGRVGAGRKKIDSDLHLELLDAPLAEPSTAFAPPLINLQLL